MSRFTSRSSERRCGAVRQGAAVHLDNVLRCQQSVENAFESGACERGRSLAEAARMPGMRAGQVELALKIGERDVEVDHGHLGGGMAEQFHQGGKINAAAKHLAGIGMAELMRNNAAGDAGGGRSLVQIAAELADEHVPGGGPCQQSAIWG